MAKQRPAKPVKHPIIYTSDWIEDGKIQSVQFDNESAAIAHYSTKDGLSVMRSGYDPNRVMPSGKIGGWWAQVVVMARRHERFDIKPVESKPDAKFTVFGWDFIAHPTGRDLFKKHAGRIYVNSWVGSDNEIKTHPVAHGSYSIDEILEAVPDAILCLEYKPIHMRTTAEGGEMGACKNEVWFDKGTDGTSITHYTEAERLIKQVVMRFGSKPYPLTALKVSSTYNTWGNSDQNAWEKPTLPVSGIGTLRKIMVRNEEDRPWDKKYGATPEQYAAAQWTRYHAVKAVDSSVQVYMTCLSAFNLPYLERCLELWQSWGDIIPFDVGCVNHYPNKGNDDPDTGGFAVNLVEACSPQDDKLEKRCRIFMAGWRSMFPEKDVIVTETGYDVETAEMPLKTVHSTSAENASKWTLDSIKIMLAAGFKEVHVYGLRQFEKAYDGVAYKKSGAYSFDWQLIQPKLIEAIK